VLPEGVSVVGFMPIYRKIDLATIREQSPGRCLPIYRIGPRRCVSCDRMMVGTEVVGWKGVEASLSEECFWCRVRSTSPYPFDPPSSSDPPSDQ